jgi:hypothetical protein
MIHGWRPYDLQSSYFPLIYGYGAQIGLSDPAFMSRQGKQPWTGPDNDPVFPYDSANLDRTIETDQKVKETAMLGREWLKEFQGQFRTWEDLRFLRENWDGPLVLKGIQKPEVTFLPSSVRSRITLSRMPSSLSNTV